jgi:hypothetical protein
VTGAAARSSGGVILRRNRRRKTLCGGLNNFRTPAAFLDPTMVTMPNPTATHYREAHLTIESASPDRRGGSHSKHGCSMDAQMVDGRYGRWLIFQTCTRVPARKM